jgi:hypothetical protein
MTRSTLILAAALVLLVIAGVLIGPAACTKWRTDALRSRVEREQSGAVVNSAQDAIATQGAAQAREQANLEQEQTNADKITHAEGASDRANPAVRDAGLAALCLRDSFRRTELGKLRCTSPAGVEEGRR